MSSDGMLAIIELGVMWEGLCPALDNILAVFLEVLTKEQLVS